MPFLLLKKERHKFLMYLYCIVIVILYCPLKEAFLYRNLNWDLEKCPLLGGVR